MWKAIGDDSWVVVPIQSAARPGHTMEGTRLTLVCTLLGRHFPLKPHLHHCLIMALFLASIVQYFKWSQLLCT